MRAGIGGPILAGVLIAWDLGGLDWRLVFLINVPPGACASPSPILARALLRKRPFVAGLCDAVLLFAGSGGLMLILSLFLQLGLHYSALHTGLAIAPAALGIASPNNDADQHLTSNGNQRLVSRHVLVHLRLSDSTADPSGCPAMLSRRTHGVRAVGIRGPCRPDVHIGAGP